jgi:hypothetical protein
LQRVEVVPEEDEADIEAEEVFFFYFQEFVS